MKKSWFSCVVGMLPALLLPGTLLAASAHNNIGVSSVRLVDALADTAPGLDRKVLALSIQAMSCALQHGDLRLDPGRLSVIDYSLPSTEPRLWVFDLKRRRLLFSEWVAHGRNSGENLTSQFSNRVGSYMSSLGAFATQETYMGGNGYSLRLQGLEPGFNDKARERAIVIHGANYVSPVMAQTQGRLGRSLGCPAVRTQVAHELIDAIQGGSFVFAYYPDRDWLAHSQLLNCKLDSRFALADVILDENGI
ncbi:MAG: murein L,D-transpeptidase catalytic domain family protein [Xanthomonadaceae bacterium]|jgi:hypothetical protein|nr:murein L,D-transpeptidase catalytic domain family protein [Xanthomonadaceae bacterium]